MWTHLNKPYPVCSECRGIGGWDWEVNGHVPAYVPDRDWITCEECGGTGYLLKFRAVRRYKLWKVAA
jgi:hypothetical protein